MIIDSIDNFYSIELPSFIIHHYITNYIFIIHFSKLMQTQILQSQKYMKDRASIKEKVLKNNQDFNKKIAKTINKSYHQLQQIQIFVKKDTPIPNAFYYNANKYDSDFREDLEEYMLKKLNHYYQNHSTSYCMVYQHSGFVDFIVFRRIMEKWPQHIFKKLRKVYVCGATFMVKVVEMFSFGTFPRFWDQLFLKVQGVEQIAAVDRPILKEIGEEKLLKEGSMGMRQSIRIVVSEIYGKKIDQYDLYSGKYPVLVLRLLTKLLQDDKQLQIEGIFRKSCDIEELELLENHIVDKHYQYISEEKDILVICGCLKKIFNNLREPLFSYEIYQLIINFEGGDQVLFVQKLFGLMGYVNQKVLVLMLQFLRTAVIAYQQKNKMNSYNLSVVFGPCFFRPKEYDLKDLIYSGKFSKVIITCLNRFDQIFEESQRKLAKQMLKTMSKGELSFD